MSLSVAIQQIEFARQYTLSLLEGLTDDEWYQVAEGCPSHIAWQVGHLAMAEYGLCLFRIRGRSEADLQLMSSAFRKKFSRGSQPAFDSQGQPEPHEIRDVMDRVHEQALRELRNYSDSDLQEPIDEPYAVEATKRGALYFCSAHEMLHAGQIGLIRRLLGKPPVR